jgi:hypothetical protein
VVGSVLLGAAALKLIGIPFDPVSASPLPLPPGVTLLVVEWELLLGTAMLLGLLPAVTRWAAVGTFAAFAAASGYAGWVGQADCGCFGRLAVNPWAVCAFDVAAVTLFARTGPGPAAARPGDWRAVRVAGAAAVVFNGVVAGYAVRAGSLAGGLATLGGMELTADPPVIDYGEQIGDRSVERSVRLVNHSDRPLRVSGGTSDCRCVATDDLPLTIAPGGAAAIRVRLKLPAGEGRFARTVWLWSDADRRLSEFRLTGVLVRDGAGG